MTTYKISAKDARRASLNILAITIIFSIFAFMIFKSIGIIGSHERTVEFCTNNRSLICATCIIISVVFLITINVNYTIYRRTQQGILYSMISFLISLGVLIVNMFLWAHLMHALLESIHIKTHDVVILGTAAAILAFPMWLAVSFGFFDIKYLYFKDDVPYFKLKRV